MQIGELARRTGTTTRALRYYEQQGLLSSDRNSNDYRTYDEGSVTAVRNIRALLADGLLTKEIHGFGACLRERDLSVEPPCDDAIATYLRRRDAVAERMEELTDQHSRLSIALAGVSDRASR